ncbi:MAG: PQQ-binding-like beta-propeller repeat protein [Halioglobus sp.]|nr:PQQ-binding-like beta-propeller repeat protein [Halioglobus sp.]MCB1708985.1 PQQ-binding-like beta-propeller repeat protein [Halioglobus sp.]MCP5123559.1 PQQ-binding-like beta-propeller repeat protein [Pseudomonadales bacterium]MCP5193603.1 PQQ-binding-like beta-propeller repeat protein [Pseudomonadales bacterium]
MRKILGLLGLLLLGVVLLIGGGLLLSDSPMKTLESLAIRHADKLPLAYLGEKLFDKHCSSCHDNPAMHAPSREALSGFSKETVMVALEFGKMQPMAAHLSKQERGLIAIYLAGSAPADDWIAEHSCNIPAADNRKEYVTNWGFGNANRRFVPATAAGIDRDNVAGLELAWSLAFPKVTDMRSQPAIIGDTMYFGDKTGKVYAIDRKSGCIRRHTEVLSGIRSAITVATLGSGKKLLVFADSMASIYALDPDTLKTIWQQAARIYETSVITGSISFHNDRLFVPVSSYEVAVSGSPSHVCCKSHGGVIALDATSGAQLWQWHGTADATLQGQNRDGGDLYGPSGVSVWSTPAVDPKRNRIYIGTGENLSHPVTDTSDAIVALDMDSGALAWRFQALAGDAWNAACLNGGANCPQNPGGDFDFGASVIMAELPDGRELLLAGQKSGDVYALNPDPAGDEGEVVWHRRVSNAGIGPDLAQSTTNGGVHWGMALSGERVLVAAADPERVRPDYIPKPGLHALNLASGEVLWFQPVTRGCEIAEEDKPMIGLQNMRAGKKIELADQYRCSFYYGLSAAVLATPELVFSAGLDGRVRAFDIASGEILWQAETAKPFAADNGVTGHGGAVDVSGQVLADGWLYVQSGYSMFGQLPGNVLLAYRVGETAH